MEKTLAFVQGVWTCPQTFFFSFHGDSPLGLMSDLDSSHWLGDVEWRRLLNLFKVSGHAPKHFPFHFLDRVFTATLAGADE